MKKCIFFRNITANILICLMLISIFSLMFVSNNVAVFGNQKPSAIYRGNTSKNNISLMINVYWGTEYIEPILNVLKNKKATATFFVGGCWVAKNSETLLKIFNSGFEIGNHGYFHKDHKKLTRDQNYQEIELTHKLVKEYTKQDMSLFAPPSGAYNETTLEVAQSLGYQTIMWTSDTIDWRDKNASICYDRATKSAKNGNLILIHPTAHTLQTLPSIVDFYQSNNYNLVRVSENISQ